MGHPTFSIFILTSYFSIGGIFIASGNPPSRESSDHGLRKKKKTKKNLPIFFSEHPLVAICFHSPQ